MKRLTAAGLCLALSASSVLAQPAPNKGNELGEQGSAQGGDARPWAAGVSPDSQRQALAKFREANAQLNDGLFAAAVTLYREALTYWDHPAINYNLALALLNLDQPLEVYENLVKAVKYGAAPLEKEKYDHAQKYLRLVEQQIATVDLTSSEVGARVSVDGKEVFVVQPGEPGRFTSRVRIGKHTIVAEKPGHETLILSPVLGSGEKLETDLELFTPEELTRYNRRFEKTWLPWAVLGGGVALGALGGLMTLSAQSSYDDFDAAVARCNDDSGGAGCDAASDITGMRDSGDTKKMLGYVGYTAAGVAVAAGVTLLILNRPRPYRVTPEQVRAERAKEKGARDVSIAPMVGPGVAGAFMEGRF